MRDPDPALVEFVRALARAAAAKATENDTRDPPDRTSGVPVEIRAARRGRRGRSDETALQDAIEAAIAAGAAPIRAELFPDGKVVLFFDGLGPPGEVEGWRDVLVARS